MKHFPGGKAIEQLDTADLDQPIALERIEASGFGIEHDFAHHISHTGIEPAGSP